MFCVHKIAMANPQVETQQTDETYNKHLIWQKFCCCFFFLFLFVEMNHNCREWTPTKRQATFSEKEMYLEVVENLKIQSKRQWIYLHSFAPRCSVTMRSIHYLQVHTFASNTKTALLSNYLIIFVFLLNFPTCR